MSRTGGSLGHRSAVPFGLVHGPTATSSISHGGAVPLSTEHSPVRASDSAFARPTASHHEQTFICSSPKVHVLRLEMLIFEIYGPNRS